ncbi:MarR family transcriptional regulator [Cryobacterium sp. TMT1-21]|uniref:MarR family transcriptional regulator n=1 Tax=Cryobacterium shii TaxID=1259235 RepID=A0AAQ2C4I2_9MICO|nr:MULTISPECIES: MarR family transcriptional regulator [Cryobacterium]TFC43344.1 MarR family transcriptional regulator [Cryobacterium shii]TFC87332.1 MarR family transcriptional regulator [Cryobacterium sp. TmT2-59]TFD14669.1 MarR family transcriptional regulator [Cryobacterium sp. TMT1-21]TFD17828.1 MarR family transcriptional regulator [Cryobacterium sp. TMT2-23]TFD18314.1 MarR family transcriptional regulator [Cryobacterium sp. TMT4-10]
MTEPRWLTDDEREAWLRLMAVTMLLPNRLEQQLKRDAGLSHFEYYVLAMISECADRSLALTELASRTNSSLSRLSHVIARLEAQGLLTRAASPRDGRASIATLTDAGWAKVLASAPGHVEEVRSVVFDALSARQVSQLSDICGRMLATLDPHHRLLGLG